MADRHRRDRSRSPARRDDRRDDQAVRVKREESEPRWPSPAPQGHISDEDGRPREVKEEEEEARGAVQPEWLGVQLHKICREAYEERIVGWRTLYFPVYNETHHPDLPAIIQHAEAFVRTFILRVYGSVTGSNTLRNAVANYKLDRRVAIMHHEPNFGHFQRSIYVIDLPAFPLPAQTPRKLARLNRFFMLSLGGPAIAGQAVHYYPGPAVIPVTAKGAFTAEGKQIVDDGGNVPQDINVEGAAYTSSHWRESMLHDPSASYTFGQPHTNQHPPPPCSHWNVTLHPPHGSGREPITVAIRFDTSLFNVQRALERWEQRQEAIKQERALGKGRREYKPLARALF